MFESSYATTRPETTVELAMVPPVSRVSVVLSGRIFCGCVYQTLPCLANFPSRFATALLLHAQGAFGDGSLWVAGSERLHGVAGQAEIAGGEV